MKMIVFVICMAGLSSACVAQDVSQSQVPSLVLNAFQSKFSDATDIDWELKGDVYKVEFEIAKRDHDLWISKDGVITKHKEDVPNSDLPTAVKAQVAKDFKTYRIDDVGKIETNGKVYYEVDLDGSAGDRKVTFTPEGKVESNVAD